ncbi:sulfite exporter TauE/SafE family protein [Clostridium sp. YIM B02515]|uniref:Probable membrane transporter protein n=1 Tax=Clostridium rhizosphaerae TaxID=2803861 RepID=A0ABS1TGW8_9CLOT|nr:sulfite exporter TauE/SafE family protein [Clostridium rhizosphaerae]MBL4938627.1 sulfite exporter TauE/SafE family protein [Clostridium rhizosphaerae]
MNLLFYILAVAIGVVTGGITSLIGASGVMIIVPILSMFFKVSVHTAIGTSLFVDVIASLTVAYSYYKNGNIELKSGIWIALTSIIGAQLGASFASKMGEGNLSSSFGIVLVIAGLSMIRKSYKEKNAPSDTVSGFIHFKAEWQKILAALIIGLGIGILSGIFGAGGGVMILLALIILMSFPLHKAIGTSTLIMAITALSSTIGYAVRGNIDILLGILLSAGAVIGGILGSRFANKINEKTLQRTVGICFTAMGIVMTAIAIIK